MFILKLFVVSNRKLYCILYVFESFEGLFFNFFNIYIGIFFFYLIFLFWFIYYFYLFVFSWGIV